MGWDFIREKFGRNRNRRARPSRGTVLMVTARLAEQRAERLHRISAIALLTAALTLAGWLGLRGARMLGRVFFTDNPSFEIATFDIKSDGSRMPPRDVTNLLGIPAHANLFDVDLAELQERLKKSAWVRDAQVARCLPDRLEVRIRERIPIARVQMPGGRIALGVDAQGCVLGSVASLQLPLIEGLGPGIAPRVQLPAAAVQEALDLLVLCERSQLPDAVRIARISVKAPDYLLLLLADGKQVILPRGQAASKLAALSASLLKLGGLGVAPTGRPITIDLRGERNVVVDGLFEPPAAAPR